jgi:hypothetical protein
LRRLIAVFIAVFIAATAAACGNSASTSDPYELLRKAGTAEQTQVQVDIGASIKTAGTTVTLDPGAIRVVIDKPAGKGTFHVSLPAAALGIPQAQLAQFGVTGSTIDLDVLWDGQALYAKSAVLGTLMPMLAAQMQITLPSGDLTGWLKLLTKADIDSFAGGMASAAPSAAPSMPDAATLKKDLEDAGITITLAGTESKNGVNANHLKGTIDSAKMLASPQFTAMSATQRTQIEGALKSATVSFDMWVDASSGKFVEIDGHVVPNDPTATGTAAMSGDLTIAFSTPSSPNFDTPSGAVEIPMMEIVGQLLKAFGGSLGSLGG